jgi:hypothetical protein
MKSTRPVLLTLIFIFAAAVPVWAFSGGIAQAQNLWTNEAPLVQPFNNSNNYGWEGARGSGPGQDLKVHYAGCYANDCGRSVVSECDRCDRCAYDGDLLRCDRCAVRDLDRCEQCVVSYYGRCDNCVSEYRCDLYRCGWVH